MKTSQPDATHDALDDSRERVAGDSQAYYDYRDGGQLEADLAKLAALL